MPLDAYSLCPGGTGKKIKFCCGDFLPELQKIDRMLEGQQYLACLKHVDRLLEQEPGRERACLLATKCLLLRATDQIEAARTTAAAFLVKYPDNQIALAEMAVLAAESNALAALDLILRALRVAAGALSARTYQAMGLTAGALLHAGLPLPARALLQVQAGAYEDDPRPSELLSALSQATDIPLLLRDDPPLASCLEGVPWKDRFTEAERAVRAGDWQTGADLFAALAADVPDAAVVWRNLATVRGWLADNAGCIDALRRYAALRAGEGDGLEDAVEAEAEAMLLSKDPLGDRLDVFRLTWTVRDAQRAQETFLWSPRFRTVPFDPAQFSDGHIPPPKAAYMLLDRPLPEVAEGLSLETVPRLLGQALLFGRETDREARLDVMGVAGDELQAVKEMVREAAGEALDPEPKEEVVRHWSASLKLLGTAWQPPRDASAEQIRTLMVQHRREAILNRWPELKLGVLDGRSPREMAGVGQVDNLFHGDKTYRVRLLAAIFVLESWSQRLQGELDFNELRAELGLPVLEPVDPRQHPVEDLPAVRLERLGVEGLSDDDLVLAFHTATAFAIRPAMRKFAAAIVERPSLADSDQRLHAFVTLARTEEDIARALEYVDLGRRAADAKKLSSASWDLLELSLRFAARDGQQAMRLIEHLQKNHLNEPGVGEALTQMLIDVGLLRPDGTPAYAAGGAEPAMAAAEEPAAEPGGLWTPDSAQPGSSGGKLWTPE